MKQFKLIILFVSLLLTGLLYSNQSSAEAQTRITTIQVAKSALSTSCTEYKIVGTCFWLYCGWGGCTVRTSVKVKHYIPDVVVSAYTQPFKSPWTEISTIISPLKKLVDSTQVAGGGDTNNRQANNRTKIRFKDTQVLGHPVGALFSQFLSGFGYYCENGVTPLFPYFVSEVDFLSWRLALVESFYPDALIPGRREVGSQKNSNMWGSVYPRSGAIMQNDDYKAGAMAVQRSADIVTDNAKLHVSKNYTKSSSDGFWPPEPIKENTNNHKWQKLAPELSMSCGVFPSLDGKPSLDGSYVYALWRPYKCCKRRGQTFLYSIDF